MNQEPFKVCPGCGGEYAASAQVCADCGGTLEFSGNKDGSDIPLTEEEAQAVVREGAVNYLQELARELAGKGIRSAIVFHAPAPGT